MKSKMKRACLDCGKEFNDSYPNINDMNARIWCNSCVDKRYANNLNSDAYITAKDKKR